VNLPLGMQLWREDKNTTVQRQEDLREVFTGLHVEKLRNTLLESPRHFTTLSAKQGVSPLLKRRSCSTSHLKRRKAIIGKVLLGFI